MALSDYQKAFGGLVIRLHDSLIEQLTTTAYFPLLNPELSDAVKNPNYVSEEDRIKFESLKQELPEELSNPLIAANLLPYEGMEELTDHDFISLFEVALLIGYRLKNTPTMLLGACSELFTDAIIYRKIDPRDPHTLIPFSKMHETPKVINERVEFIDEMPDLSWMLSLKEAAEFAILKGYPPELFNDLLNPGQVKNEQPATQSFNDEENRQSIKLPRTRTQSEEEARQEKVIDKLLEIILGMAIDSYGYDPDLPKNKATGNQRGSISYALSKYGLNVTDDTIKKYLDKAVKNNPAAKPLKH